jgi:hypothetical protein
MLKPVLNEVSESEFHEGSREEIEQTMQAAINKLHYVPFSEDSSDSQEAKMDSPEGPAFKVLNHFAIKPVMPIVYRCEELGMSEEQIRKLIAYLQKNEWLGPMEDIPSGKPGKPMASALVLPAGLKVLGISPEKYKYCKGKGKLCHRVLQRRIQDAVGGIIEYQECDVYAASPDGKERVCYEIELQVDDGHEHYLENLRRDSKFADRIIFVVATKEDVKKLKRRIKDLPPEEHQRVEIKTISEVMKHAAQ